MEDFRDRSREQDAPDCSVVIPVYNEEENLRHLHDRLKVVFRDLGISYEIVLVDDGSTDRSPQILRELCQQNGNVRLIAFSRNFGHHAALTAGIDYARGEVIVTMDGDLQDRPEEIAKLLDKVSEGYDVAYAVRTNRQDTFGKRLASSVFVVLMNRIIAPGVPIHGSVFMAMDRKVANALRQCREVSRFLPGLIGWLGFNQGLVEVRHGARHAGESKYNLWRSIRLAVNTMTSFSYVPLRIATWLGLSVSLVSFGYGGYVVIAKLLWNSAVQGYPSLMVAVLFIGGAQLTMLGVFGEYVGRAYTQLQGRPLYVVDEVVGNRSSPPDLGGLAVRSPMPVEAVSREQDG